MSEIYQRRHAAWTNESRDSDEPTYVPEPQWPKSAQDALRLRQDLISRSITQRNGSALDNSGASRPNANNMPLDFNWLKPIISEFRKVWVYVLAGTIFLVLFYAYRKTSFQEWELHRLRNDLRESVTARMSLEKKLAEVLREKQIWESRFKDTRQVLEKERELSMASAIANPMPTEKDRQQTEKEFSSEATNNSPPNIPSPTSGADDKENRKASLGTDIIAESTGHEYGPVGLSTHLPDSDLDYRPFFDESPSVVLTRLELLTPTRRAPIDSFAPPISKIDQPLSAISSSKEQPSSLNDIGERASKEELEAIRSAIRDEIAHAYYGYERYAAGFDELRPLTRQGQNSYSMGLTVVDSLSTLLIAGLESHACRALDWIHDHLSFNHPRPRGLNSFEITIRVLGGMLSAHALLLDRVTIKNPSIHESGTMNERFYLNCSSSSRRKWDAEGAALMLLRKSRELGEELKFIFDSTPTGTPLSLVDLTGNPGDSVSMEEAPVDSSGSKISISRRNYAPKWLRGGIIVSEAGTVQLEWVYLAQATGNSEYAERAMRTMKNLFLPMYNAGTKLLPRYLNPVTKAQFDSYNTWGAGVDSIYEYFYKQHLLFESQKKWLKNLRLKGGNSDDVYAREKAPESSFAPHALRLFRTSLEETKKELLFMSYPSGMAWLAERAHKTLVGKFHHLTCFAPGTIAMSAHSWMWQNDDNSSAENSTMGSVSSLENQMDMDIAEALARTCYELYARTPTGLAAETYVFGLNENPRTGQLKAKSKPQDSDSIASTLHRMNEAQDPNYFQRTITMDRKKTDGSQNVHSKQEAKRPAKPKAMPRIPGDKVQPLFPFPEDSLTARSYNIGQTKIDDFAVDPRGSHNLLRPEAIESMFILYRLTRNEKYRLWAWEIFKSFVKYCRVPGGGYAGLKDVRDASIGSVTEIDERLLFGKGARKPTDSKQMVGQRKRLVLWRNWKDHMESFWTGETLKYLYLMFLDEGDEASRIVPHNVPLDKWVFNTEAHPLPLPHAHPELSVLSHRLLASWDKDTSKQSNSKHTSEGSAKTGESPPQADLKSEKLNETPQGPKPTNVKSAFSRIFNW